MEKTREQVDLRGLTCPEPVIRTKKLFDNPSVQAVEALVDDDVCVNNLQRLARSLKAGCTVKENNGYFTITLERGEASKAQPHQHPAVEAGSQRNESTGVGTIVLISKDEFGAGDPEFSRTLMNVFLQTTFESGFRPRAILLMNTGVRLMAKGAQTVKVLDDFRSDGVEVLVCGLCADFYKVKEDVPKEQITNMFAICEYLYAADRIIQP